MALSKILQATVLCLPIMACASVPPAPVETKLPDVAAPTAEPVVMQGYKWKVYKSQDIEALSAELKAHPKRQFMVFAVTPTGYQRMNGNYLELQRYIQEQKAIIVYLKKEIADRSPDSSVQK